VGARWLLKLRRCQCSRSQALLGVRRARLLEGRLVARAPAANRVGMEGRHGVAVGAVHLEAVADVNVAVAPEVSVVLPWPVDDVPVERNADSLEGLLHAARHVGGCSRSTVLEACAWFRLVRELLRRGGHAGGESVVVIEGSLRSHATKTVVALALESCRWHCRLGIERIEAELGVAVHDRNASERDADHAVHVAEVVGVALGCSVSLRPVEVADLAVQSCLSRDRHRSWAEIGRVEVGLEVDQVLLRRL
jgi:hypothetical protein